MRAGWRQLAEAGTVARMERIDPIPARPRRARFALVALTCVLTAACADPAPAPPSPDVWAIVDGREIRKEDVERAYRRAAAPASTPSDDEALTARLGILDDLIDQDVLLARALALKVEVTDADVEKAFTERRSTISDEAFQKELSQRALTAEDMKRDLRRQLTVDKLMDQEVGSKIAIDDETIRAFYEQNRARFNVAETRHRIAQIVVAPGRDPQLRNRTGDDAATPAEAQRKLQMLVERLKGGADFASLAMDYSEDPQSAPQGGDLGFIPASALNQVAPQLRETVLEATPGDVATVSIGGAHAIVLLVDRETAGQRDLNTPGVRDGIRDMLRQRREQLLSAAYLAVAREEADVVNYLARRLVEARGAIPTLGLSPPGRP
jgi:peptidyl-prolyl cis-trans isomerase SurA